MIQIYYANSLAIRKVFSLENILQGLPENIHEKAFKYRFERDAFNYVLGRLMLKRGIDDLGKNTCLNDITYNEKDKPTLEDLFFNISHSGDLVLCVTSDQQEIGVDIERQKKMEISQYQSCFTNKEWTNIVSYEKPWERFYWYWTRKESIIKALGVSLDYLNEIELNFNEDIFINDGKEWYLNDLNYWNNYAGAICTEQKIIVEPENLICMNPDYFVDNMQKLSARQSYFH